MGIRAERRARQEVNRQILTGGKAYLPAKFVLGYCAKCSNGCSKDITTDEMYTTTELHTCKMQFHPHVQETHFCFDTENQTKNPYWIKGNAGSIALEVNEKCPQLVMMLMEADVKGLFTTYD